MSASRRPPSRDESAPRWQTNQCNDDMNDDHQQRGASDVDHLDGDARRAAGGESVSIVRGEEHFHFTSMCECGGRNGGRKGV